MGPGPLYPWLASHLATLKGNGFLSTICQLETGTAGFHSMSATQDSSVLTQAITIKGQQ